MTNNTFGQLHATQTGFTANAGLVLLPKAEGNGSLDNTPASAMIGVGTYLHVDALIFEGGLSYVPAKNKLFTVGARIMLKFPIKSDAVTFPWSGGVSYRSFVSNWDLHCVGLALQYNAKTWFAGPEFGFATRSLKTDRPTTGYFMVNAGLKFNMRY